MISRAAACLLFFVKGRRNRIRQKNKSQKQTGFFKIDHSKNSKLLFLQQKSWTIGEKDGTGQEKVSLGTFGLPEIRTDRDKKNSKRAEHLFLALTFTPTLCRLLLILTGVFLEN